MTRLCMGRSTCGLFFAAVVLVVPSWQGAARADDAGSESDPAEKSIADRAIEEQVASFRIEPRDPGQADLFEVAEQPLLSYSDPARGYAAAGLWRIGKRGRPLGYVSVEYWNAHDREPPRLSMEFLSMTDMAFELSDSRRSLWTPQSTGIEFRDLEGLAKPAGNERLRLRQFKAAAQRFEISERLLGEPYTLRMLPNPIDRYNDPEAGIVDGAGFAFAYGTNPEAVLLLECTEEKWQYGVAHTSSAEVTVQFDGQDVLRIDELRNWQKSKPHSADWYNIVDGEYLPP